MTVVLRPFSAVIVTLNRNIRQTTTMPTLMANGCSRNSRPFMVVEEIADDGDAGRAEEHPELDLCQKRAVELGLGLLRQKEIGRAHEAHQRPHDQRVGVDHPDDVERQEHGQRVRQNVDRSGKNAEQRPGRGTASARRRNTASRLSGSHISSSALCLEGTVGTARSAGLVRRPVLAS